MLYLNSYGVPRPVKRNMVQFEPVTFKLQKGVGKQKGRKQNAIGLYEVLFL